MADDQMCVRCKEYDSQGTYEHAALGDPPVVQTIFACRKCEPVWNKNQLWAFYVTCDRCGEDSRIEDVETGKRRIPNPEEFDPWGRAYPGEGEAGRCVKCDTRCEARGEEINTEMPEWTLARRIGTCAPLCTVAVLLRDEKRQST